MGEKRVDIKTGFICNNNCRFCAQAHKKYLGNRTTQEIKKDLEKARKTCIDVVFTGGEPTIRSDILELISYAKQLKFRTIQIQTNGRMFSYLKYCKDIIKAGANDFAPALHGYCSRQHDFLTRNKGSFEQTVKGIKNLKKLGQTINMNTVVVKQNYKNLPEIARLLVKLKVDQFQFAFVHPIGNAYKYYDEIIPRMGLAVPYIKKGLQIGIDANISVMAEAIPYCMMKGYEKYVSENFIPETKIIEPKMTIEDYKKSRMKEGKTKFLQCKQCKYDKICEGPWKEYPEKKGNKEFKPVKKNGKNLEINKKMAIFKEHVKKYNIELHHILLILQVYFQIKPNATIDNLLPEKKEDIQNFLKILGLYYKIIDYPRYKKLILGNKKKDVERMSQIHEVNLGDYNNKSLVKEYGKFLGYPECCINKGNFPKKEKMVIDYRLSRFSSYPFIFHHPCSENCKKSLKLVKKVQMIYSLYDKIFYLNIKKSLLKPVLVLHDCNFIIFDGRLSNNILTFSSLIHISPSNMADQEFTERDLKIQGIVKEIKKANKIIFDNGVFRLYLNKKLIKSFEFRKDCVYHLINPIKSLNNC
ncbi:MAG: radical SAM protein [Nanoarchaeota archaeon]|nr:radical SAM protein [Nanoarchaeota archaeon]